jgi:cleavage and polyadenylation specificity factor subunit 1
MFNVLTSLAPPQCVECVAEAHFTSSTDENLIVGRSSMLQVYRLCESASVDDKEQVNAALCLVAEKQLFGRIESIATVRAAGWPRDLLAVSFRDCKVCVLQFDATSNSIVTVSMHYFETYVMLMTQNAV